MELEIETGVRFCRKFTDKQLQVSLDLFIVCKAQQFFFWGVRVAIPAVRAWVIIWRHETHAQDMRLGSSALNTAMDPGIDEWLLSVSKSRSCIWRQFPCETLGDLRTFYVSALPIMQGGEEAEYDDSMWTSCTLSMMFITYVYAKPLDHPNRSNSTHLKFTAWNLLETYVHTNLDLCVFSVWHPV